MTSLQQELGLLRQIANETKEVEQRAQRVDEMMAADLTGIYAVSPNLNREIMTALAMGGMTVDQIRKLNDYATSKMVNRGVVPPPDRLEERTPRFMTRQALNDISVRLMGGPGTSGLTPVGARPSWVGETLDQLYSNVTQGYQDVFDAVVPETISSTATRAARGAIRTGVMTAESVGQFAQNRISQAIQYADSKGYEWWDLRYTVDFANHLAMLNQDPQRTGREVLGAAGATDVGQAVRQFINTGQIDTGSGYFPEGTVDAQQAQAQRDLLGTLPGPAGEQYAYTPGRRFGQELVDVGLLSHDSILYSAVSGSIDGLIKAFADPFNAVGGTRVGVRAIKGAKMPRNAAVYNRLATDARQMMLAGNERQAILKMRQAQEAIGIRTGRLSDDAVREAFESTDEATVMLRGQLMDEAGIYRDGDTVSVSLPEYAKFISQGNGRRLVDLIIERNTGAQIMDLFEDNIGPVLAGRLAKMTDRTEIIRTLGQAYGNPGTMLQDAVTMFPNVGVFNVWDKATSVRRSIGANVRSGKYLPPGSILDPKNGTEFIHDFKVLANSLPIGLARTGYKRFDPRIVDEYVNRFIDAYTAGNRGQLVEAVSDFEQDLVRMFERLGYTLDEATEITRWSANADRLGQYLMKDLAANNPTSVAESGIALYQDMLNSGMMLIDNNRLQEVLRSTGRTRQILKNNPATSKFARLRDDFAKLSDKLDEAIDAGRGDEAAKLAARREKVRIKIDEVLEARRVGVGPKDIDYWTTALTDMMDAGRYYWKSSTIVRIAYVTRVLPDEIARVLAGGSFDDPVDWFAAVATGGYRFDATGQEFIRNNNRLNEAKDKFSELFEAREAAVTAGDDALAVKLTNQLLDQEEAITRLEEAWDASRESFHKAMIARDGKATDLVMRERLQRANATGTSLEVNRFNEKQFAQWEEALFQQLLRRSADPVMSEMARAMLGRSLKLNAPFDVGGVTDNLAGHLRRGRIQNVEEGIAHWLFSGPGSQFWEDFVYNKMRTGTGYDVNSFDSVVLWVNTISDELAYITGGRPGLQGVVRNRLEEIPVRRTDAPITDNFKDAVTGQPISGVYARGVGGLNQSGVGDRSLFGPGLYATPDVSVARRYAIDARALPTTEQLIESQRYGTPIEMPLTGEVFNIELSLENPLVLTPKSWNELTRSLDLFPKFAGSLNEIASRDKIVQYIKSQGHDGVIVRIGNDLDSPLAAMSGGDQIVKFAMPAKPSVSRLERYDESLVEVIATGRFNGQRLTQVEGSNIIRNPRAMEYAAEFRQTANAPDNLIYRGKEVFGEAVGNKYQQFINFFFGTLYGVPSDVLARSPLYRRIYWNVMTDLVRSANPETAAQIVRNGQKAKLAPKLMDRLVENSRANLFDASLDELDQLAKARALAEVKDLLFDATKRGAAADSLRFVVSFGDAWKEVMQTYGKLLINRRGKPALRVAQGIYAGMKTDVGGPGDIYGINPLTGEPTAFRDNRRESVIYKDPVSGDAILTLPFSRDIISWATGLPRGQSPALVTPLTGYNLAGSIVPGFGPVIDVAINGLLPQSSRMRAVRDFFFPYGEPASPESVAGQEQGLEKYLVPSAIQKMAAGFRNFPGVIGSLAQMVSQAESNVSYQNARNHVARALMASKLREYKQDQRNNGVAPDSLNDPTLVRNQEAFREEATRITDRIWLLRGIAQFIGPASPFLQWYVDAGEGNVLAALVVDELNKSMTEYIEQGASPDLAVSDMIDKYGVELFMFATPNTESTIKGIDASDEWLNWYLDNRQVVDEYKLVGAFFGPTGDFSNDARQSMLSQGLYTVKTLEQQFEDASFTLSYAAYNRERANLGPETRWSEQETDYLARFREALENQFGIDLETFANERRLQIGQIDQMINDARRGSETALQYLSTPLGEKVQQYMAYRVAVAKEADRRGTNWERGKNAADLREIMRDLGAELSEDDPQFARIYQFVFAGEMLRETAGDQVRPQITVAR